MSKITLITPTHNRPELLAAAMESVLAPRYPGLQYIVVDDASGSETASVVQQFIQRYPGVITYVRNAQNLGESGSINRGWSMAEGEYVASLSDDDLLLPNWFEHSVAFMDAHPQLIAAYPDWHVIDDNGKPIRTIRMPEYDFVKLFASCGNAPGPGVIMRAAMLRALPELRRTDYRFAPDYAMWLTLATLGPYGHIPHITSCWRRHPHSFTVRAGALQKTVELNQLMDDFLARHTTPAAAKLRTRTALHSAYVLLRGRYPLHGLRYILRALTTSPTWACVLAGCYLRRVVSHLTSKLEKRSQT